ncbi:efflux RND transporter periplasmic adaptor subunit [Candidatus Roizmanbacteria bacterium]|nr:efflux RND transporter periplasmic adaptor subunit [Candidatus Roizmanbacteria bacterium]
MKNKGVQFFKRRWYLVLILLLSVGIIVGKNKMSQVKIKMGKPYLVKKETIRNTLSLSGKIDADEKVTLRFQTSGRLTWVGVKEGDIIKKYQTVATLDQRDLQNKLQQYLNSFVKSRYDLDQARNDNQGPLVAADPALRDKAKRLIEDAQYDLNNSVLTIELQQLSIEYSRLISPIDGVVVRVASPKAGVNITPTQAEFVVINPQTIYFAALADQTEVVKLSLGQTGQVSLDAFPDKPLPGTISTIAYTPKEGESGTVYEVKVGLSDNMLAYRMGMTGDAEFVLGEKSGVVAIPSSYIRREKDNTYVWVETNRKRSKTFITTGQSSDTLTEVISGLQTGEVIYDQAQ